MEPCVGEVFLTVGGVLDSMLAEMNPVRGGSAEDRYGIVVNSSSYMTWNCGLTMPVLTLRTRETEPA